MKRPHIASPEALEIACRMIYEYFTGKCWHCKFEEGERSKGLVWCTKCGLNLGSEFGINPPLAISLDAWAEHIWPVMNDAQRTKHHLKLKQVICNAGQDKFRYEASALLHLETALEATGLYEQWEAEVKTFIGGMR